MFIKRLKPNVYDVFIGNGWDNWTRIRRNGPDSLQFVAGRELHRNALNEVKKRIIR